MTDRKTGLDLAESLLIDVVNELEELAQDAKGRNRRAFEALRDRADEVLGDVQVEIRYQKQLAEEDGPDPDVLRDRWLDEGGR